MCPLIKGRDEPYYAAKHEYVDRGRPAYITNRLKKIEKALDSISHLLTGSDRLFRVWPRDDGPPTQQNYLFLLHDRFEREDCARIAATRIAIERTFRIDPNIGNKRVTAIDARHRCVQEADAIVVGEIHVVSGAA